MTTINDVARLAGVSKGTVSRYLNGSLKPKDDTIRRIEEAIRETNYIPNKNAASIKTKSSRTIAVVIPSTKNITFAEIAESINNVIDREGYSMVIYTTNDRLEKERLATHKIRENRLDGAIFITEPKGDKDMSHIAQLEADGIQTVLLNRFYKESPFTALSIDYHQAVMKAMKHLWERGYRRVGLILGWDRQDQSEIYRQGYMEALQEHGQPLDEGLLLYCDYGEDETREAVRKLMKQGADAILTISDRSALIAMEVAEEAGWKIPEDLAIIGSGNTDFSRLIKMTSLDGRGEGLGRIAAQLLLQKIQGERPPAFTLIDTDLVVRETTR